MAYIPHAEVGGGTVIVSDEQCCGAREGWRGSAFSRVLQGAAPLALMPISTKLAPPPGRREMRARSLYGGFEFMAKPSPKYYKELPKKIGDVLTPEQYR